MSLGLYWLHNLRICSGKPRDLTNGLRSRDSGGKHRSCLVEIPENIGVLSFSEGLKKLAGRQGFFWPISRNPNKDGPFRVNLAAPAIWRFRLLSSAFVYSRLFSSCASAMTLAAKDFGAFVQEDPGNDGFLMEKTPRRREGRERPIWFGHRTNINIGVVRLGPARLKN